MCTMLPYNFIKIIQVGLVISLHGLSAMIYISSVNKSAMAAMFVGKLCSKNNTRRPHSMEA